MNEVEASGRVIAASAEAECASSSPRRRVPLFDYRFALRVALWLCRTSWFLHRRPLPETIRRCSSPRRNAGARMPLDRAIYLVDRVCQLRVFPRSSSVERLVVGWRGEGRARVSLVERYRGREARGARRGRPVRCD